MINSLTILLLIYCKYSLESELDKQNITKWGKTVNAKKKNLFYIEKNWPHWILLLNCNTSSLGSIILLLKYYYYYFFIEEREEKYAKGHRNGKVRYDFLFFKVMVASQWDRDHDFAYWWRKRSFGFVFQMGPHIDMGIGTSMISMHL